MPRAFCRLRALFVALLLTSPLAAAPAEWYQIQTPRFTLLSQLSERDSRRYATEFTEFIGALQAVVTINEQWLPPLTIVLFRRERDYQAYAPKDTAGFFASVNSWSVIGLADQHFDKITREVVLHEGGHWYFSASRRRLPKWVEEGLASAYATFTVDEGLCRWGAMDSSYVLNLEKGRNLPLELLLTAPHGHPLFKDDQQRSRFYAQSWALVHYLVFGDRQGPPDALERYLAARERGSSLAETCQTAFGCDLKRLERDFEEYVDNGRYHLRTRPVNPQAAITEPWTPAPAAAVAVALARLALVTKHLDLARRHIEAVLRDAPATPAGHELLATLEWNLDHDEPAYSAAARAIELGSNDALVHYVCGYSLWGVAKAKGAFDGKAARQIANLFEHAINLQPNLHLAYSNLGLILPSLKEAAVDDRKFLEQGRRFFPEDGEIVLGLAAHAYAEGDRNTAMTRLADILDPTAAFSSKTRARGENLAWGWAREGVRKLYRANKFEEAAAEHAAFARFPASPDFAAKLATLPNEIAAARCLDDARRAAVEQHPAEALRLLDRLVTMPDLPKKIREGGEKLRKSLSGPPAAPNAVRS